MIQQRKCKECGRSFEGGPRAYYCHSCRAERQRISDAKSKARARKGITRKLGSTDKCERCDKEYTIKAAIQRFCPDCKPIHTLEYARETSIAFYHENKEKINPIRNKKRRIRIKNCVWCNNPFNPAGTARITCSYDCKRQHINRTWREYYHLKKGTPEGAEIRRGRKRKEPDYYIQLLRNTLLKLGYVPTSSEYLKNNYKPFYSLLKRHGLGYNDAVMAAGFDPDKSRKAGKLIYKSRKEYFKQREQKRRAERINAGKCPQCGGEWIEPEVTHRGKPKHCRRCQVYFKNRRLKS